MKYNFLNTTKALLIASAMAFTASGCLKQYDSSAKEYNNDNPSALLEFVKIDDNHLASISAPTAISLNSAPAVETVNLGYLRVASPDLPTASMNVVLRVDTTQIPAGYIPLPAGSYTINTNFTTGVGVRNNPIQIQLTKTSLDLSKAYAIALVVSNPGTAKVNPLGNILVVEIGIKNKYDGVYRLNLRLDNWQAYGISSGIAADFPTQYALVTSGLNSVIISSVASAPSSLQPAFTGDVGSITGPTSFGAAAPKYFFDSNDKVSSVVNTVADDGRGRAFYLDPASTTSQYTTSTRGLKVEYFMKQNGRPDQKITATYTYLRAR